MELTKLSEAEEKKFQSWIKNTGWFKEFVRDVGKEPNLNTKAYDYRGAWKAGVVPKRDKNDNNRYHWSSSHKSEDHPTMWKDKFMKKTGKNPDAIGIKSKEAGEKYIKKNRNLLKDAKMEKQ